MIKLSPNIIHTQGSMTQKLRNLSGGELTIKVLQEKFCDYHDKPVWLRDVELWHGQQKFMSARVIVEKSAIERKLQHLLQLGDKPIGDWLFKQDYKIVQREIISKTERTTTYEVWGEHITIEEQFVL